MSLPTRCLPPRPVRRGATFACVFASVLVAGAATGSWEGGGHPAPELSAAALPVREAVDRPAVAGEATDGEATDGEEPPGDAARLVSRSGDRWSAAYSAREYEAFQDALAGTYVGTGIAVVRAADGRIKVSRVHGDSPAERAGVRPGDELRTVDGVSVDGRPVTDAVSMLRGSHLPVAAAPGSAALVGLERAGQRWVVAVERAKLNTDAVSVSRDVPGVTRIRVATFTAGSADLLRAAVHCAPARDGIVLDLRGNAGGLLTEAADAASVFLDGGLVATYDVHGSQRALHAERGGDTSTPLVVLVDGGTMSSAELVTGALQDRNRAVVVGSRTFGKGTVQMPSEQPDGSVAELTVGHYVTPSGGIVHEEKGIVPDLVVDSGEDAEERARTVLSGLATGP